MSAFHLYDDAAARDFEPFAMTRPVSELRAGALLVRERWALVLGAEAAGSISAAHLADFDESGAAPVVTGRIPAGSILVNARAIPTVAAEATRAARAWRIAGRLAAIRLHRDLQVDDFEDGDLTLESLADLDGDDLIAELEGDWLDEVWDLVGKLPALLARDIPDIAARRGTHAARPEGCAVVGAKGSAALYVEEGADIEPFTTFDLSTGPIYVERGAHVLSHTRIAGPCWIGRGSTVGGDRIQACSIGDTCKVHGEVTNTVFLGHCNKGHDGFVGHSYLGRWVNLGAQTVTSNLKNTYGAVELWTPQGIRSTGEQFLGTLFGDHAKTGIGLPLTTGTVLGAGTNVYGAHMPPKAVTPFSWGDGEPYDEFRMDKFLEVAARVMARRKVELSDKARRQLEAARRVRWTYASESGGA